MLRRKPDLIPILNNLSLVSFMEGRCDEAIATAERVLALDDDNYHALSNLVHYFCVGGRADDAQRMAQRLKAVVSDATDVWTKIAEARSYLGDDGGVLEALRSAEGTDAREEKATMGTLYHLAAVAALRLGRETEARRYWRQALRDAPWLDVAQANLDDLQMPVGERHTPWPFVLEQWIPRATLDAYLKQVEPAMRRGEEAARAAQRRFLQRHPEVVPLIPLLLDRGDPDGRAFALQVAVPSDLPNPVVAIWEERLEQAGRSLWQFGSRR